MVKFGTLDYYNAYADALSKDPEVQKATDLKTNFMYIFSDVPGPDGQPKAFILTIDGGKVTAAEAKASAVNAKETDFASTATYAMQVGMAKGEINPQKSKLKVNMMKAVKNRKILERIFVIQKEIKDVEY